MAPQTMTLLHSIDSNEDVWAHIAKEDDEIGPTGAPCTCHGSREETHHQHCCHRDDQQQHISPGALLLVLPPGGAPGGARARPPSATNYELQYTLISHAIIAHEHLQITDYSLLQSELVYADHRASHTPSISCSLHWTRMVGTTAFNNGHRYTLLHCRQCNGSLAASVVLFSLATHVRRIPGSPLFHIFSPIDILTLSMVLVQQLTSTLPHGFSTGS